MSQSELYEWIANLDCSARPDEDDEPTQVARLAHPKFAALDAPERVEQLVKSATASYFHTNLVEQIRERIGSGDALDELMRDSWARTRLGLKARQL